MDVVISMQGDADLMQIVLAVRTAASFAGVLHRGQQKRDERADNGNHHQ